MMWADHSVWTEEGQVTRCGRRKARSLGVDGGRPGHSVWTDEDQISRCGWRRAKDIIKVNKMHTLASPFIKVSKRKDICCPCYDVKCIQK